MRGIKQLGGVLLRWLIGQSAQMRIGRTRHPRELELLNRYAPGLNAQGDESAAYQAAWDSE